MPIPKSLPQKRHHSAQPTAGLKRRQYNQGDEQEKKKREQAIPLYEFRASKMPFLNLERSSSLTLKRQAWILSCAPMVNSQAEFILILQREWFFE
ncbi:hypothetical protein CEXT_600941 [Caerostris extrusa]|uniref:Uncharacterized protein n=1 Tax=Caerostris extrusa TaxID=172846 RepID=A0AAV4RWM4_CAEEX|nr:hypothetical protein CEXT_600941 [Caerostris extrusa]